MQNANLFNVRYGSVIGTMAENKSTVSSETAYCTSLITQARGKLEQLGGLGNAAALEGLEMFASGADLLAEATVHFMTAISGFTMHLESEEKVLANSFDLF